MWCHILFVVELNSFAFEIRCNQFNCEKLGFDLLAVQISNVFIYHFLLTSERMRGFRYRILNLNEWLLTLFHRFDSEGHSRFDFDYHKKNDDTGLGLSRSQSPFWMNEELNCQMDTRHICYLPIYLNLIFNYCPQYFRTFTCFDSREREVKWTLLNIWYDFRPNNDTGWIGIFYVIQHLYL